MLTLYPVHLHNNDVFNYYLGGLGLLLAMHAITYAAYFIMKEYLKIIMLVFGFVFYFPRWDSCQEFTYLPFRWEY